MFRITQLLWLSLPLVCVVCRGDSGRLLKCSNVCTHLCQPGHTGEESEMERAQSGSVAIVKKFYNMMCDQCRINIHVVHVLYEQSSYHPDEQS